MINRIEHAMTALVLRQPFFATLALRLRIIEAPGTGTFAVDGRNLKVDPAFLNTLDNRELLTVLAHEVLHCAMGHIWRFTPQTHPDWQALQRACDYEVNAILVSANEEARKQGRAEPFPEPKCGWYYDARFKDMAAEIIYRELTRDSRAQDQGSLPNIGAFEPAPASTAEQAQLKEIWERAVVQAAEATKGRGHLPASLARRIEKIIRPAVDWKALLRDFVRQTAHEDYSFSRVNQRYMDSGFYLPTLRNERIGRVVFAIDTSGSIPSQLLAEFIGQAQLVLDELAPDPLTVICCDAEVTRCDDYQPGDRVADDAPGGGGTDFRPVFDRFMELDDDAPVCLVYLTDLDGRFPTEEPPYPVLWVSWKKASAPFGEVVFVEEER